MKMLGQDVHTQAEFDEFKEQHHDPLVNKIKLQQKWLHILTLVSVMLISVDVVLLFK